MKSLPKGVPAPPKGRVLDIGCGNNSFEHATHLLDRYQDTDEERNGPLEIPAGKEFKEGSIEAIPYPDHYFQYVHAAHVLEHVTDPHQALSELERVAPRGYIETPAAGVEQGSHHHSGQGGWKFHRYFVWNFPDRQRLYFKPKTPQTMRHFCKCEYGQWFKRVLDIKEVQDFYAYLPYEVTMTIHPWESKIHYERISESQTDGHKCEAWGCDCLASAFFHHLKKHFFTLRNIRRRRNLRKDEPDLYGLMLQSI